MFEDISAVEASAVNGTSVLRRLIEGIGYRFHRAMLGVEPAHLAFRPAEGAFTLGDQVTHLGRLIETTLAAVETRPPNHAASYDADAVKRLIEQLHAALGATDDAALAQLHTGSGHRVWHLISGPLADSLHHIGQINLHKRLLGIDSPKSGYMDGKRVD